MSDSIATTLEEYVIMAMGAPATPELMDGLRGLYDSTGDYTVVDTVVNNYMNSRIVSVSNGEYGLIQEISQNGLGLLLAADEAIAVTNFFNANGYDTWSKRLAFCSMLDGDLGTTLLNRAIAAGSFCAALDTAAEKVAYATPVGRRVAADWLALVTHDSSTLTSAQSSCDSIIARICSGGDGGTSHAVEAVIDLGSYGKLIAPVQVDGHWYYYWDRSGDGTSANTGSLNDGRDSVPYYVLHDTFSQDINGVTGGNGNTTDTFRYAILNGVRVALPTDGTGTTTIYNYFTDNRNYTDLAEIWDTYNCGYQTSGVPSGWAADSYWSATPYSSWGNTCFHLYDGFVSSAGVDDMGMSNYYVCVEVLETTSSVTPSLIIAANNADKAEGNSGSTPFTFTVNRTGSTTAASSASYSVSGSSATASDFTGGVLPSGTVSFVAGETSKTITINVAGDTTVEPDETFNVVLSNPSGVTLGTATAMGRMTSVTPVTQ